LVGDIVSYLKEKSSCEAFSLVFKAIDEAGSGVVECEDFRWGLIDLGYNLTKFEAD